MADLTDEELERWLASVPCARYEPADMQRMAGEIRRHRAAQAAGKERVREVVREVFAKVSDLSGAEFAQRHIEDIATRVADQLNRGSRP